MGAYRIASLTWRKGLFHLRTDSTLRIEVLAEFFSVISVTSVTSVLNKPVTPPLTNVSAKSVFVDSHAHSSVHTDLF
jgi:hypothetical protein